MINTGDHALPTLDTGRTDLVPLPGGQFRIWPVGALRSAGFPLAALVELGDEDYAAHADRLALAERGRDPEQIRAARAAFEAATTAAEHRQADLLSRVAGRPDVQEAVVWQNRAILDPVLRRLAGAEDRTREPSGAARTGSRHSPGARLRSRQRTLARYWARYCAKNETVGFFGPVCWVSAGPGGPAVDLRPGPRLIRRRTVYAEGWAIEALAARIAADSRIRPWLAPRRNPTVYLDGALLRHLAGPPVPLDPMTARLVGLCDGERTARDLAAALLADPAGPVHDEQQVFAILDRLVQHQVLFWDLDLPVRKDPARELRTALERIGDPRLRAELLAPLEGFEAGRVRIAGAASVPALEQAMADLESSFVAHTAQEATTNAGQTYGGRQLVYLDTVRDLDARVGGALLDALGAPLSILLHGARWLTQEIGRGYRQIFEDAYEKLLAEHGGTDDVDLVAMLMTHGSSITELGNRPLERGVRELTARFAQLLGLDTDAARVEHSSAALAVRAGELFGDAHAGWPQAQHHSIDLQVAASSLHALRRGEFLLVLGELHLAFNPLEGGVFSDAYPDGRYLPALMAASYPRARVMVTPLKGFPRVTGRTVPATFCANDWWLAVGTHIDGRPERRLALAGMVVRREGEQLRVRTRDGRASFDLVDIGGAWGAWEIMDSFKVVASDRPHTPRVTIDRLVVCRESWTAPVRELTFPAAKDEAARFVGARDWAHRLGLPRFVFAKLSTEVKPFYVDLASSVLVGSLASSIRSARAKDSEAQLTISEMLPGPGEVWLPDAAGNCYTSELRLAVIDPVLD